MKPLIAAAGLVALLTLGGCSHGQINTVTPLTGCTHPSGWCDQIRTTAEETWLHAQMAANAYRTPPFDLGPDVQEIDRRDNDAIGYAYVVFVLRRPQGPTEWVIAFRGTENDTLLDWWNGNLLARQNRRGLATYDDLRRRLGPDARISVTGHSLGGGIATYVSLCRENTPSFIFNSSPRFHDCRPRAENIRQSVVERGEVLKALRVFGAEATQTYTSVNCARGLRPVSQHNIAPLALCLTAGAAWNSPEARASLTRNNAPFPAGLPTT